MNPPLDLWSFAAPVCHADDPESSRLAAADLERTGRRSEQAKTVLAILARQSEPLTAVELWAATTEAERALLSEMQRVRQRLTDLYRNGLASKEAQRPCRVRGSTQLTWAATETGRRECGGC